MSSTGEFPGIQAKSLFSSPCVFATLRKIACLALEALALRTRLPYVRKAGPTLLYLAMLLVCGVGRPSSAAAQVPPTLAAPQKVAWGKPVNGLQAGLSPDAPPRAYTQGETASFTLQFRNVGKKTIQLQYYEPALLGWTPKIMDASGQKSFLWIPSIDMPVQRAAHPLPPGAAFVLGHLRLGIRPPHWKGNPQEPVLLAPPGKYRLTQNYRFGWRGTPAWSGEVWTGTLEIDVVNSATSSLNSPHHIIRLVRIRRLSG